MDNVLNMLRIIFVFVVLDPITSFGQSPLHFENNYKRNSFIIPGDNQKSQETNEYQNYQKSIKTNAHPNAQTQRTSVLRRSRDGSEKTFEIISSDNDKPNFSRNSQYIHSLQRYSQKWRQRPLKINNGQNFHTQNSLSQNSLFSDCNATSNTIFIRKSGSTSFQGTKYLLPGHKTTIVYKAPDIPPADRGFISTATKQPSITKHQFYTRTHNAMTTKSHNVPVTKPPVLTYHSTQTNHHDAKMYEYDPAKAMEVPFEDDDTFIKTPVSIYNSTQTNNNDAKMYEYDPAKAMEVPFEDDDTFIKPPVSIYNSTQTNNNDAKMYEYDPAKAMEVPFEDDDTLMGIPAIKTEKPTRDSSTGFAEGNVVLKQTTPNMKRPIDRDGTRGDVPDEYEDSATPTATDSGEPAPAMANSVPPEPEGEMPTTTKILTTVVATLSTTNKIQTMGTLDNDRNLIEESSITAIHEISTTTPVAFKGNEYLPPKDSTTETVPVTTMPNTATSAVAPASAMSVPTETEEPSIPSSPSTTPATSTLSMITKMTIPYDNHHVTEDSASTTLMNKMQTTLKPFKGQEYLPPKSTTRVPAVGTTLSAAAPAMSMNVPPEPEGLPTSTSPSTLTLVDTVRAAETSTNTPIAPDTNPFKAPEYLPPTAEPSPLPAIAKKVPPEPECDSDSDNPKIDPRGSFNDPCTLTTSTVPTFKGASYLPPLHKTRVKKSSKTLSLSDLEGTPRPVWYAGVYRKTTEPPYPICGGSIVREDVVISAAHCFWDDGDGRLQSADWFAVTARKVYKRYNHPMDKRAQYSDVVSIKIPPRFLGAKTSFQNDIAVLKLATPFTFTPSVSGLRPICVDFDLELDRQQMRHGHMGTVAGWGLTDANGTGTGVLLWLELPYVEIEKCITNSEPSFLKYITCDKVCAGENDTGKALCRGDSGGGLAFWQGTPMRGTPYLRGVASTAPARRDAECNVFAYGSFTHVRAHRTFLRDHVPDIETCRFWEYK